MRSAKDQSAAVVAGVAVGVVVAIGMFVLPATMTPLEKRQHK